MHRRLTEVQPADVAVCLRRWLKLAACRECAAGKLRSREADAHLSRRGQAHCVPHSLSREVEPLDGPKGRPKNALAEACQAACDPAWKQHDLWSASAVRLAGYVHTSGRQDSYHTWGHARLLWD